MNYQFRLKSLAALAFTATVIFAIPVTGCSRKSGCPAENVHVKTDADGMPKAGKTKSGLLPPNAKKKKKS